MRLLLLASLIATSTFIAPAIADPFDDLLAGQDSGPDAPEDLLGQTDEARVDLPLNRVIAARQDLTALVEARNRPVVPAVRMVAAHYRGRAEGDRLALTVDLDVALGRPDAWKTVPLLGSDAVLVSARLDDRPVPVSVREGFHVWITRAAGPKRVRLEVLVPSRGKRGAIEFDFGVARTPVTRFECDFDQPDLTPRVAGAVDSTVTGSPTGTRLDATLPPTLRVNLVGPKAIGEAEARAAEVFVASQTLVTVGERVDLFTQLDYTLLYAPVSMFKVRLPAGTQLVSAEGPGAFRHRQEGDLLIVETGQPVKDSYSMQLHLRRASAGDGLPLAVPVVEGAQRQSGWIAVEVAGNLRLAEQRNQGVHPVDVRELPGDLRTAAVAPILKAWRHDRPDFDLALTVNRLEAVPVDHGAVDEVVAFSALSPQGTLLTEMRMLFYNQLRHRLAVRLPDGAEIRSAILDGAPIGASRDADGRVLLPLSRSKGSAATLEVSIIVEQPIPAPGLFGRSDFELPVLDLPVRLVRWSVFLPSGPMYSELRAEVAPQHRRGSFRWRAPTEAWEGGVAPVRSSRSAQAAGPVPVRINVPRSGHRLNFKRYWIGAGQPIRTHVLHVDRWVVSVGVLIGCAGLLVCLLGVRRSRVWLIPALGVSGGVAWVAGGIPLAITGVLALGLIGWRGGWYRRVGPALWTGLRRAWAAIRAVRIRRPESWKRAAIQASLIGATGWIALHIVELIGPAARVIWP